MHKVVAYQTVMSPGRMKPADYGMTVVDAISIRPPGGPELVAVEYQGCEVASWSSTSQDAPFVAVLIEPGSDDLIIDAPIGSIVTLQSERG